ncbi:MFS transporter [Natronoglycomyces albus]|uniref:MFS transporter n=1 Tax=Natronoglycomyces albus TaxID=2811108 RepID=A0A895XNL7_9ACTN|nr:MFS transporter [Natronoglycomyces albus]QSB04979.1 MFS transporter [Natronoglycomyces albus]
MASQTVTQQNFDRTMTHHIPEDDPTSGHSPARTSFILWMLATGIILAALNLRTAVTSTGVILEEIRTGLAMPEALTGLLTTLPVLAFAAFGAITPVMTRRWGHRSVMSGALVAMSAGLILRAMSEDAGLFLFFSLMSLAAGAVGNVALPGIIKKYFPHRAGSITTAYSVSLALGGALAAFLTVPAEQLMGDWRPALAVWAIPSMLAIVPWLLWNPRPESDTGANRNARGGLRFTSIWRTPIGKMILLFCACQYGASYILLGWLAQVLRDAGFSPAEAGAMFGFFVFVTIPVFLATPALSLRATMARRVFYVMISCYPIALVAILAGLTGPEMWLWVTLLGIGMGTFPMTLTFFNARARTHHGTAALSGFAQPSGYLLAAGAPFLVGWSYGVTDGWAVPFAIILLLVFGQLLTGRYLLRPNFIEDQIAPDRTGPSAEVERINQHPASGQNAKTDAVSLGSARERLDVVAAGR